MSDKKLTIVYYKDSDLKEAEYNHRTLTEKESKQIINSMSEGDFNSPIKVNTFKRREGVIIGGHSRKQLVLLQFNDHGIKYPNILYKDDGVYFPCTEHSYPLDLEKKQSIRDNETGGSYNWGEMLNDFGRKDLHNLGIGDAKLGLLDIHPEGEPEKKKKFAIGCILKEKHEIEKSIERYQKNNPDSTKIEALLAICKAYG